MRTYSSCSNTVGLTINLIYYTIQVFRMLDFLRVSYSPVDVAQGLEEDATQFQRKHSSEVFDPYTKGQRIMVRRKVEGVIAQLKRHNKGNTLGVEEYLVT